MTHKVASSPHTLSHFSFSLSHPLLLDLSLLRPVEAYSQRVNGGKWPPLLLHIQRLPSTSFNSGSRFGVGSGAVLHLQFRICRRTVVAWLGTTGSCDDAARDSWIRRWRDSGRPNLAAAWCGARARARDEREDGCSTQSSITDSATGDVGRHHGNIVVSS